MEDSPARPNKKNQYTNINVTKPNFSKDKKSERISDRIRTYNITMASASHTDKWGINTNEGNSWHVA